MGDGSSELGRSVTEDASCANGVVSSVLECLVNGDVSSTNEDGSSELGRSVTEDASFANGVVSSELEHSVSGDAKGANGVVISELERSVSVSDDVSSTDEDCSSELER